MTLAERISAWRRLKGMTPQQLADAVGVSAAAVYQWEGTGKSQTNPSEENREKLVKALGLTMAKFYGRIPKSRAA